MAVVFMMFIIKGLQKKQQRNCHYRQKPPSALIFLPFLAELDFFEAILFLY